MLPPYSNEAKDRQKKIQDLKNAWIIVYANKFPNKQDIAEIRKQEGKLQPVIVDIHLKGNTATRQAKARSAVYIKQGYDIKVVAN